MWKNILQCLAGTGDSIAHALSCWRTKATTTHSEYVVLFAIPPQKWLLKSASVLRYIYTAFFLAAVATFAESLHLLGLFL
jgi:hypothetical protein